LIENLCNLSFEFKNDTIGKGYGISLSIENLSPYNIVIFRHSIGEKEIKDYVSSIRYHDTFPGKKGTRRTEAFRYLANEYAISMSGTHTKLTEFHLNEEETAEYTIPFYSASIDGQIIDMKRVSLSILLKSSTDYTYFRLLNDYKYLLSELDTVRFCPNIEHHPSLEDQKKAYHNQKKSLLSEIDSILNSDIPATKYDKYNELKILVSEINPDDEKRYHDCGLHIVHHCKYCSWSLRRIYQQMDSYYQQIYSSGNIEEQIKIKQKYWKEISLMFQCCTSPENKVRAQEWANSQFRGKIQKYYSTIKNIR